MWWKWKNDNKHISICDSANEVEIYLTHAKAFWYKLRIWNRVPKNLCFACWLEKHSHAMVCQDLKKELQTVSHFPYGFFLSPRSSWRWGRRELMTSWFKSNRKLHLPSSRTHDFLKSFQQWHTCWTHCIK